MPKDESGRDRWVAMGMGSLRKRIKQENEAGPQARPLVGPEATVGDMASRPLPNLIYGEDGSE